MLLESFIDLSKTKSARNKRLGETKKHFRDAKFFNPLKAKNSKNLKMR